ncbi:MAG: hypothetical protein HQL52_17450 [Magnetococcales bacterium]|nr:hypothetical protein [Magnetococcales bacterium]
MGLYSYKGSGKVYARPFAGGKLRYLGNNKELKISVSEEVHELKNYDDPQGGTADIVRRIDKVEISVTLSEFSPENLALSLHGTASQTTADSITDEVHTAYTDGLIRLAHIDPTSVTVTSTDGGDASAWTATTSYSVDTYVTPVGGGGRYYKCTAAGDSDGTEPVWPTDGSTIVDGTAAWQDMGLITRAEDSDYQVTGAGLLILPGGLIEDGRDIKVGYDYTAEDVVNALTESNTELTLVFDGVNTAHDDRTRVVDIYRVRFGPVNEMQYKSDSFGEFSLTGTLLADSTKTGAGISKYFKETTPVVSS